MRFIAPLSLFCWVTFNYTCVYVSVSVHWKCYKNTEHFEHNVVLYLFLFMLDKYVHMYQHTCVHSHTRTHSGTHTHRLTQAYMYKYTHTHICMNTHLQYTKPSHSDKPESNPVSNNLPMGWPESRCLRVVPSQHQSADWEWRVRWARSDHMSTAPGRSTGWCRWPAWRLQRTLSNQNTCLGHQK